MKEEILERLEQGKASVAELAELLGVTRRTVFRYLGMLKREGRVDRVGKWHGVRYVLTNEKLKIENAKLPERKETGGEPPLVDLKITNPVTYLKRWWARVMANEGVDIRLRIRPLTMIAVSAVLTSSGFVFGRITLPEPVVRYIPQLAPAPSPSPWKETAFTGVLQARGGKAPGGARYYLTTGDGEAVTLEVPRVVNAAKLVGRRILAIGSYNSQTKVLKVADASDVEIVTGVQPVPLLASPSPGLQ